MFEHSKLIAGLRECVIRPISFSRCLQWQQSHYSLCFVCFLFRYPGIVLSCVFSRAVFYVSWVIGCLDWNDRNCVGLNIVDTLDVCFSHCSMDVCHLNSRRPRLLDPIPTVRIHSVLTRVLFCIQCADAFCFAIIRLCVYFGKGDSGDVSILQNFDSRSERCTSKRTVSWTSTVWFVVCVHL